MKNSHKPYGPYEKFIKRPLDSILATCALVVLSPVMGITALLVKKNLGSPVLFTIERPGKDEEVFTLYKFRSMTDERDENGNYLPDTVRLTPLGRKLRATSLDELPELLNIIKGDMAVVGPRPLSTRYLPYYTKEERHRHDVRPGLTGLAQINGRNDLPWDEKFQYDIQYVNGISFWGDAKIVFQTIKKVLIHEGIGQGEKMPASLFEERKGWRLDPDGAVKTESVLN